MNRIIGKNIFYCSFLHKNILLYNVPKYTVQNRFNSTSTSNLKIKNVEISSPESDMLINTDSNKFGFITDSPITHGCEEFIISLHDCLSIDWSSSIFLTAFLFRLSICFPIKVYQEYLMAKLVNLQPKIKEALEKSFKNLKKDSVFLSPEIKRKIARQTVIIRNSLYKKENCQPQKIPISSFLQMPFWIYLSSAFRNLTFGKNDKTFQMEQISNEAFVWLSSLASSDPHAILPGLYCGIAFSSLIYASLNGINKNGLGKVFSFRKYLSISFILAISYFISNMPSSVGLFWISSNFFGLIELILLDSILVRRLLRIPKTTIEPVNIYTAKLDAFKNYFKFLKK